MKVAILSHWCSGSSLLARLLNLCGMVTGNKQTGWSEECEAQCEHGPLNTIGNVRYHTGKIIGMAPQILESYVEQAKKNKWNVCGVKFTHVLQAACWEYFGPIFKKIWPDAKYIISVRHPMGIITSLKDVDITPDAIVESWMSAVAATKELAKAGAIVLIYPDSFMSKDIRSVPAKLGLKWSKKATDFIDQAALKSAAVSTADAINFKKVYPEAAKLFEEISKYA